MRMSVNLVIRCRRAQCPVRLDFDRDAKGCLLQVLKEVLVECSNNSQISRPLTTALLILSPGWRHGHLCRLFSLNVHPNDMLQRVCNPENGGYCSPKYRRTPPTDTVAR